MTFAFPRPHFTNPYSWPDQQPNVNTSLLPFPPHKKHPTFCWSHVLCRFIANIRTSSSTYKMAQSQRNKKPRADVDDSE